MGSSQSHWPKDIRSYKLGTGRQGIRSIVSIATWNGRICLIKQIKKTENTLIIDREILAYQKLALSPHENIIEYYQLFEDDRWFYIVMKKMYCSLLTVMDDYYGPGIVGTHFTVPLDRKVVATILAQVLAGLNHIHERGIVHRDVKLENVLLSKDGTVVITDFSVTGNWNTDITTLVGSSAYMAPEIFKNAPYGPKVDLWSFGILAIALASGAIPNKDLASLPAADIGRVLEQRDPPTLTDDEYRRFGDLDGEFAKVVRSCMEKKPEDRVSAANLMRFKFFENHSKLDLKDWIQANIKK